MFRAAPATRRPSGSASVWRARFGAVVLVCGLGGSLVACAPPADDGQVQPAAVTEQIPVFAGVSVVSDVPYGTDPAQRLDVCQPADASASLVSNGPRRAIISVHGGSWRSGDKAGLHWRSACEWLASEGFVAFSLNYRLAPAAPFPAAISDVQAAVAWLRQPQQVAAYGFDPALIGAFGGSAGGNLVSLLGAGGSGPWDVGSRVAAVAQLSAPIDLTGAGQPGYTDEFQRIQLEYLGCTAWRDCAAAENASPHLAADPTDPPFFIGHAAEEFIPFSQAETLADALQDVGVPATLVKVPGSLHSVALLDDAMRAEIIAFFREHLQARAT